MAAGYLYLRYVYIFILITIKEREWAGWGHINFFQVGYFLICENI